jgi:16S rRNA processing protein RimM
MAESFISVGTLGKPHGISGAFRFSLALELKDAGNFPKVLFIDQKGSPLPYFVASVTVSDNGEEGIISFEEVTTREATRSIANSELLLKEKDVDRYFEEEEEDEWLALIGYTLQGEDGTVLGEITNVIDNTIQPVAVFSLNGNEIMVPLAEELIVEIDDEKEVVILRIPEGLIEAYTQTGEFDDED